MAINNRDFAIIILLFGTFVLSDGQRITYLQCKTPKQIAITFDDGPHPTLTNGILDVLKQENLTVTFFTIGLNNWEWDQARYNQTTKRVFNEGHQVASHSYSHFNMQDLTAPEIRIELKKLQEYIYDLLGVNMTAFRPPEGSYSDLLLQIAQDEFNYAVILWNLSTDDWSHPEDVQAGMENYIRAFQNVSENSSFIALHHDWPAEGAELARQSIQFVKANGFEIVTVSKCIGIPMYQ